MCWYSLSMRKILSWIGVVLVFGLAFAEPNYKLRVMFWTCSQVSPGTWVAAGQVFNQSGQNLDNIRVNLRVVDSKGMMKGTNSRAIDMPDLKRSKSSRFRVAVRTSAPGSGCQIWFRNNEVIQIPTRVPALHPK